MESIYGPPPGARQPVRGRKPAASEPSWKRALGSVLVMVIFGVGIFSILLYLDVDTGGSDIDDALRNIPRLNLELPRYEPLHLDLPAFKPLQSADIIPRSAIIPAGAEVSATPTPKRLQTAGIISR